MGFDVAAIAGHGALSAGSRPDGPSWFPYAFVALWVVLAIIVIPRFLKKRKR
ncbi:hypothetical protein ACIBSV_11625 [Embleya sp. NPDC050154]|uniref:hypothetical protein n=1 Tax=unclassified Embleya TaxID=2699296 RepID=UPI0037BD8E6A